MVTFEIKFVFDSKSPNLVTCFNLKIPVQGNARKYYVKKKSAAIKELKTIESHGVAMKSAEKKTKQVMKCYGCETKC